MSDHNPKPMNKEELEKYIEKDFLPSLLSKFSNIPDLEAEYARLKAEVERMDTLCKQVMAQHSDISCENIMLRKVGDEMAELFGGDYSDIDGVCYDKKWNAAKEGKGKP